MLAEARPDDADRAGASAALEELGRRPPVVGHARLFKFLGRRIRQVPARGVRGLESAGVVRGAFSRFRDPLAGGSLEYLDGSRRVG